ncbi:hypothetical protein K470DRAFT_275252, partial [Piedraia hortae CBS 480.64]
MSSQPNDINLKLVLACANKVHELLNRGITIPPDLSAAVNAAINRTLPIPSLISQANQIDIAGCQLWNTITQVLRKGEIPPHSAVPLRVLAFYLLDTAYQVLATRSKRDFRVLKTGLKTGRFCLDNDEVDLGLKVLKRCSEHINDDEQMEAEFYLLRMMHAWKSNRLDQVDDLYYKVQEHALVVSPILTEQAVDLCYKIAKELIPGDAAMKWLKRALDTLDLCNDSTHASLLEWRLVVTTAAVDVMLVAGKGIQAMELVEILENRGMDNRIAVAMLRLRTISAIEPVDQTQVHETMIKMLKLGVLTEGTFNSILRAIHKVRQISIDLALEGLRQFIFSRLLPDLPSRGWMEAAVVTFILFATFQNPTQSLGNLFTAVYNASGALSQQASHSAQTILWKNAEKWLSVLQHPFIFSNSCEANQSKVLRKAMTIYLQREDISSCREAYLRLPPSAQNDALTHYLAFRLAIASGNEDHATHSLQHMAVEHLYSAVIHAQRQGSGKIAIASLTQLLESKDKKINTPVLLRCIVRLLLSDGQTDRLISLFERAASEIPRHEALWWTKQSWNLLAKTHSNIEPTTLLRLINSINKFFNLCTDEELQTRKETLSLLAATANLTLARQTGGEGFFAKAREYLSSEPPAENQLEYLVAKVECLLHFTSERDIVQNLLNEIMDLPYIEKKEGVYIHLANLLPSLPYINPTLLIEVLKKCCTLLPPAQSAAPLRRVFDALTSHSGHEDVLLEVLRFAVGKIEAWPEVEREWFVARGFNYFLDLEGREEWRDVLLEMVGFCNDELRGVVKRRLEGDDT